MGMSCARRECVRREEREEVPPKRYRVAGSGWLVE